MKTIELTDEEYEFLCECLMSCHDRGPEGSGWQSDELEALRKKIDSVEITHSDNPVRLLKQIYADHYPDYVLPDYLDEVERYCDEPVEFTPDRPIILTEDIGATLLSRTRLSRPMTFDNGDTLSVVDGKAQKIRDGIVIDECDVIEEVVE